MNNEYYDDLAAYYRLIYPDWEGSVERQATKLDEIISEQLTAKPLTLLDAACGIGTQCLGLAERGYRVTASDLSPEEVKMAKREAEKRGLQIDFHVADMREVWQIYQRQFDVVVALDNAIPHLLDDAQLLLAFEQFFRCTKPGGLCLVSVRDYAKMEKGGTRINPRIVHPTNDGQIVLCDVWKFEGVRYQMTTYVIHDRGEKSAETSIIRGGEYYCVEIPTLEQLLLQAGFSTITTERDRFFQPLILAKK